MKIVANLQSILSAIIREQVERRASTKVNTCDVL